MPTDQGLIPTPAAEWGTPGFVVLLPSGRTVRVTRSKILFTMLKDNNLPNPLARVVGKMMEEFSNKKRDQVVPEDILKELGPEGVPTLMRFVDDCVISCMLEPRCERPYMAEIIDDDPENNKAELKKQVEWEPTFGAISLEQVEMEDRAFIFQVAMGGATDLESFREQSKAALASPQYGADVFNSTVGAVGAPTRPKPKVTKRTTEKKIVPGRGT